MGKGQAVKDIILATDFSTRSERALRRGLLFAKQFGAALPLVYVIDDDKPPLKMKADKTSSDVLLENLGEVVRKTDRVECRAVVAFGSAFDKIAVAGNEAGADLFVIGSYRRHLLDIVIGITAERIVRASRHPVLVANGVPAAPYRSRSVGRLRRGAYPVVGSGAGPWHP